MQHRARERKRSKSLKLSKLSVMFIYLYKKYSFILRVKKEREGPGTVAQVVKGPRLACPGSHMGTSSNPRQPRFPSSSLPVAPESSRGRPKALGPCTHFGTLHPHGRPGRGSWLRIGIVSARCAHLGSESSDGRSSSLSLLSVYPPFQ